MFIKAIIIIIINTSGGNGELYFISLLDKWMLPTWGQFENKFFSDLLWSWDL